MQYANSEVLSNSFFDRDTRVVAKELLGKYLVRRYKGKVTRYRIVETEACVGPHDKASHAHRGRTARNEPMWAPPGNWYVYFTYGMHYMLNIVTGRDGYPAAILIRGVKKVLLADPRECPAARRAGMNRRPVLPAVRCGRHGRTRPRARWKKRERLLFSSDPAKTGMASAGGRP